MAGCYDDDSDEDYGHGYYYDEHHYDDDSDRHSEDYGHDYYDEHHYDDDSDRDSEDYGHGYDDEYYDDEAAAEAASPPRSRYQPEVPPGTITDIIKAAMTAQNVKECDIPSETQFTSPENVKKSLQYFEVKGFAWFSCPKKHHRWPSAQSWCFMDLKTQTICYRDVQKCKKCESKASPEFTREALERMAKYAVKSFLIETRRERRVYRPRSTDTEDTQGGPHDEGRCGRCQRLGRSCWK